MGLYYDTIILNNDIETTITYLSNLTNINNHGNIFVIISTEYDSEGNVKADFLDVLQHGIYLGYKYVNTIVVPAIAMQNVSFMDNVRYIVWFTLDTKKQYFNKDEIREPHIWKNIEWGKRKKNYHPKGKDPGNVWIPTDDDGKGNITRHKLLDFKAIINRLLKSSLPKDGYCFMLLDSFKEASNFNNPQIHIEVIKPNYESPKAIKTFFPELEKKGENSYIFFSTSENMDRVPDNSISVVITSPPYWDLKDYFKKGQIGQEPYCQYLNRLKNVWKQCYMKLCSNGSLWININLRVRNNKVIPIPKDIIDQCKLLGFHYKGIFIWHKSSGIPTREKNLVDRHEYILVFSKSKTLTIDKSKLGEISDYKNTDINGTAFWNINRKAGSVGKKYKHPAIYPVELVERIISATTTENQIVLDPFLGSGTTLIASENIGRKCIGYEYNEAFKELIKHRMDNELRNKNRIIIE